MSIFFIFYSSVAIPQIPGSIWKYPAFTSQPLTVPTVSSTKGDILVDNFEYWDSPYNHGWFQSEPPYPVYGFGMGYATIFNTILDLQEGSRVLDVYRPASIFLLGTPYEKHFITQFLFTPPTAENPSGAGGINLDPNHASYGNPEPYYTDLVGRDFVIDINLPVFANSAFRIGGSKAAAMRTQALGWNATIGSYGANGIQTSNQFGSASIVQPLPINPYDGMPTYIMLYYYTGFKAVNSATRFPSSSFGKAHYGPIECFVLESALWNAGLVVWPHIAFMDFTPLYFEDLIMTIEVTNGLVSDVETFPISVVNYPVENYPPVVQMRICPRIFYVGEEKECAIWFADPDSYIFSIAQLQGMTPSTSHVPNLPGNVIRDDQDQLTYQISANGLPSYQYGPWMDTLINPCNGITKFVPKFEGVLITVVTCTDNRGAMAVGQRRITMVNRGTWLNHPPMMERMPVRPIVIKAGEEFILTHPQLMVTDPDGDQIYASCNIGSVGHSSNGNFIWTFQTNFPGFYSVEIIFYDIRGGYAIMRVMVDVKPWWSY